LVSFTDGFDGRREGPMLQAKRRKGSLFASTEIRRRSTRHEGVIPGLGVIAVSNRQQPAEERADGDLGPVAFSRPASVSTSTDSQARKRRAKL
jgi:hypothetical protein